MSNPSPSAELRIFSALADLPAAAWNALVEKHGGNQPFLRHEFLNAFEATGCVGESKGQHTGWQPAHITLWEKGSLVGAMPAYLKYHSYGEYVFDWAWADAYQRNGLDYYPKLLAAIPFSPITGARLLTDTPARKALLAQGAIAAARELGASSFHCLFPLDEEIAPLQHAGMLTRHGTQFHWQNKPGTGYASFDEFLATFTREKRKKIKQERRKVAEAGITFEWFTGTQGNHALRDEHWTFLHQCYRNTYRLHRSTPYLNLDFFRLLGQRMPDNCLIVIGSRNEKPLCAAFNIYDRTTLWGRYWGALETIPNLHFETCYYQALEFCIARNIQLFEGGAQGEHKLARGLMPEQTQSMHWLAHPEFSEAVEQFLEREQRGVAGYIEELKEHAPFRKLGQNS
ncbi:MAG: N-acetyltransferase [Burkholderiaceae bacterium]|nr:MAG: N-acetyltransferase [Burkholderiaceae bacterium]